MEGRRATCARPNRRAGIMFLQDSACDCCDEVTEVAILDLGLINFHWNVCKKCLMEFTFQFYSETEIRKLKLKQINETKEN